MEKTKPILVVRFPIGAANASVDEASNKIQDTCSDYNVVALTDNTVSRVEFEIYNKPE